MKYQAEFLLPFKRLSPNWKGHWALKKKAADRYKDECSSIILSAIRGTKTLPETFNSPVIFHFTFFLYKGQRDEERYFPRDADNAIASIKYLIDSFRHCGVLKDDGFDFLKIGEIKLYSRKPEHQNKAGILITIEEEKIERCKTDKPRKIRVGTYASRRNSPERRR